MAHERCRSEFAPNRLRGRKDVVTDLRRQGRQLEVLTTAWNFGEVVVALTLGFLAGSLALVAFGLDSLAEIFASLVVLWHLGRNHRGATRARRLLAGAFVALGLYLGVAGAHGLLERAVPSPSPLGVGFLASSVVVMVALAVAKRRVGTQLLSTPLLANATMTLLDGALAGGVLVALVLDQATGWWWANPAAALAVALVALTEGARGWRQAAALT
jgi:divalent metal cation (Fe/Co/Zn/Cd) transporter